MLKPLNKWIRRTVLLPLTALSLVATAHAQTVTIGVQSMFAPWKDAIAQKQFEQATGWDIQWRNFDSGGDVMMAMASGDVQIGVAGSSPIAAAVSRGVDAQLFWILDNIADAEALVVTQWQRYRRATGPGRQNPRRTLCLHHPLSRVVCP